MRQHTELFVSLHFNLEAIAASKIGKSVWQQIIEDLAYLLCTE